MILDIHKAYHRLKSSQKWVFRFLTKTGHSLYMINVPLSDFGWGQYP